MNGSNESAGPGLDGPLEMENEGYGLAKHVQIFLVCLYICTVLLAVAGNGIVCYVVFALQRLRNVTNFFIVNLSISDIIVTALCIPFTVLSNLIYYYWPFGSILCPLVMYLQLISVLQRAMTLVAMTLDRHYAIWKPLKRRITKSEAKVIIGVIWITSALISLPIALNTKISFLPYEPGNLGLCMEVWSDAAVRSWYSVNIMMLQYFIPLGIMCGTYVHIGIIVWIKRTPGEADSTRDSRLAASKKKTVKMLIAVVITYALCWLPLHVITITGDIDPSIYNYTYVHTLWLFAHWLAVCNCFSNPIIYCWFNATFRHGFIQVLYCKACKRYSAFTFRPSRQVSGRSLSSNSPTNLVKKPQGEGARRSGMELAMYN